MATLFANPRYTPVDAQGDPYPGATLTFYAAGTTTPQPVYTTSALTTPHPNPVTANSAGQFPAIYYDDALQYRAILRDATGVLLWDIDLINSNLTAEEIGRALYTRTTAEISAGVTPTFYRYPPGDVRRYGATGNGVTDDTTALQNAHRANDRFSVYYPAGNYVISGSITVYNQHVEGECKEWTFIRPTGNFPAFVNDTAQFISGRLRGFNIFYGGTKPTVEAGNGLKVGIRWSSGSGPRWPTFFDIEDIEVRGAWYAYFDDSGSYGGTLKRVFARDCKFGFRKENGTTYHFENCITLDSDQAFFLNNLLATTMTVCASDGGDVTAGGALNEFRSCTGLVINGWDSEANNITGNDSCMFSFLDTTVTINGYVGYLNTASAAGGEFTSLFKFDDSQGIITGSRTKYNTSSWTFTGSGAVYGVLAINGSSVFTSGNDWDMPTGGTPSALAATHATGTARVQSLNNRLSVGAVYSSNTYELLTDAGEFTGTLTGCTTTPTGTLRWRRNNNTVTLFIPAFNGTSNATTATITGAPSTIFPARAQTVLLRITDNGTTALGMAVVETTGVLTLSASAAGAAFTNSGTKGVSNCTITYSLD